MSPSRTLRQLASAVFPVALAGVASVFAPAAHAQLKLPVSPAVSGSYVVVFREGAESNVAQQRLARLSARTQVRTVHLGTAAVQMTDAEAKAIAADPAVEQVVPDRMVYAHALHSSPLTDLRSGGLSGTRAAGPLRSILQDAPAAPSQGSGSAGTSTADTFYAGSPQGWAVRASGGYGAGYLGETATGPWNRTLGNGVRIAILDSGVDRTHPDLAPNLALNLSEVDTAAQPSPCDDGSAQDQQGHGTWVASLAAGAMGKNTGRVVGVAPSATLLNIKVLQRTPGAGATLAARCTAGQAAGLVSWLLKGIDDAIAQHADVIVLSLGSIVDLYTGDGAGLKVAFDRATHAAANAGILVVAAAGNDAFDLSDPQYVELPAQARDVLAVVASTNPSCAEDNRTGAACTGGTVGVPYYSNYGAPLNAVAAPGGNYPVGSEEDISGWVRGACSSGQPGSADGLPNLAAHSFGCFNLGHQAYVQAMGTSASAGLVAGAAALLRAAHPAWTPGQLGEALRSTGTSIAHGASLVNTQTALNAQP